MQFGSFDGAKISELIGKIEAEILTMMEVREKFVTSRK
jgi:hypothetical protein